MMLKSYLIPLVQGVRGALEVDCHSLSHPLTDVGDDRLVDGSQRLELCRNLKHQTQRGDGYAWEEKERTTEAEVDGQHRVRLHREGKDD